MSTYIVWKSVGQADSDAIILSGVTYSLANRLVRNLADEYPRHTFWMESE